MNNEEIYHNQNEPPEIETAESWEDAKKASKIILPEHYKTHCSKIGDIMGVKGLGVTGETHIQQWYLNKKYGRKKDWYNKFVDKGLAVEGKGIEMLAEVTGNDLKKNEQFFYNDFFVGTPDVIFDGVIYDIKSAWNIFTFPFYKKEIPNKDYAYQLQGYMDLTGIKKAVLVYVLINTPQPIIQNELKKLYYESGGRAEDWTPEVNIELSENYKFNDIPLLDRIKTYEVAYDEIVVAKMKDRVEECRRYIKENIL